MRRYPTFSPARSGFTLIDLLVVIAIIAILASFVAASAGKAKAASRNARCKSNLRQLGIALAMYVNDNGGYPRTWISTYEVAEEPSLRSWLRTSWYGNLMLYCLSTIPAEPHGYFDYDTLFPPLFRCPASPAGKPLPPGASSEESVTWDTRKIVRLINKVSKGAAYGYNSTGSYLSVFPENGFGLGDRCKESDVRSPSDMIAIGCSTEGTSSRVIHPSAIDLRPGGWHTGGRANIAFADVHVDLIRSNVVVGANGNARRRWNRDNQPHSETW